MKPFPLTNIRFILFRLQLNKIIEIARSRLPSNSWLQSKLISWMNIDASCNAYWNGQVNFYRSSSSCANTGELAGVFDHEVSILVYSLRSLVSVKSSHATTLHELWCILCYIVHIVVCFVFHNIFQ